MSKENKQTISKEQPNTLLKCPFCGGEAELKRGLTNLDNFVKCKACGCGTKLFNTKKSAITAWNTRKPVGYAVEALKKPIWIEHTDDLTLNEIAETAIKQTREVAIQIVKEILNE